MLRIVTIGVYGFGEDDFFRALLNARVDLFCDIRSRRGMRGSTYAFANSKRLQRRLGHIGIRYCHAKELGPSQKTREKQKQVDRTLDIGKRSRTALSTAFIKAYEDECLSRFDSRLFIETFAPEATCIALFCVEGEAAACHRSLVARRLAHDLLANVEHIRPWTFS
jgi:uncharacterized protein (DUF488 family)